MMAQLLAHDLFNVALASEDEAEASEVHRVLLEASAWLPVMFEQQAGGRGSVPRVAMMAVSELADATFLQPDSPKFWFELRLAREADAVASTLRGLMLRAAHARLDSEAVVPLTYLAPWQPAHLQFVSVRVNDIELKKLQMKSVPTTLYFTDREAANAGAKPTAAVLGEGEPKEKQSFTVDADNWRSDPRNHGKALFLRPPLRSPTPDIFFYAPVSTLRLLPGWPADRALRPVLIQEQIKGDVDLQSIGKIFLKEFKLEEDKALTGLAAFDNVFLALADYRAGRGLKAGLQTQPALNMHSIYVDAGQFCQIVPRRAHAHCSS